MAYLENLLRLYNEEIHRLQLTELSLDDLASEDSLHIQEHKLKRKVGAAVASGPAAARRSERFWPWLKASAAVWQ